MQDNQALIVVDVQKDFLETGALPVKEGSQVVPVINRIIPKFKNVVFTQDWHPEGHISFASSHPGEALYSMIDVSYGKQVLCPSTVFKTRPAQSLPRDSIQITASAL